MTLIIAWLAMLGVGLTAVELYARYVQGDLLWSWPVQRPLFFELDRFKLYNRRFYENHRGDFRGWPIPLELFDADAPTPKYIYKPNLRMALREHRLLPARPGETVYWSTNAMGFRPPKFSVNKSPNGILIVCLGASTTEGSSGDTESYPYYLRQELSRLFPQQRIEVINAGFHNYEIDDSLAILEHRLLPLNPDVVVYYEAVNNIKISDFLSTVDCDVSVCWLNNFPAWYQWLYPRSAAFLLLSERLGWSHRIPPSMPHQFDLTPPKPSAEHYRTVLQQIVRETLAHHSRIVLSSFVTVAHAGFAVTYAEAPGLFNDLYEKWYPLTPQELEEIFSYFNRQSAEVAAQFQVPYADVAARFPKEIRYFPNDSIHPTPQGYHLLATEFAEFLAKNVLPGIIHARDHQAAR